MKKAEGMPRVTQGQVMQQNRQRRFHRKIRLDAQFYREKGHICLVTICTWRRVPLFSQRSVASKLAELLKEVGTEEGISIYAYCIMPDHLHLLLSPSGTTDIVGFVMKLKSLATRSFRQQGIRGKIWQTSFYDHFLRKEEDLKEAALYILNNPVRKGLAAGWQQYRWCGGSLISQSL